MKLLKFLLTSCLGTSSAVSVSTIATSCGNKKDKNDKKNKISVERVQLNLPRIEMTNRIR